MDIEKINDSLSIRGGRLFIEDCDATDLANTFGTPLFVISENHLRANLRRFKKAFEDCWPEGSVRILPAFKANPLIALRHLLTDEGCGCDIFGPGELEGALRGGVAPKDISVNGSVKDRAIIRKAIDIGARIVLDAREELELCEEEASDLGKTARVMLRIKPYMDDLDTLSDFVPDQKICKLTQTVKYGIPASDALNMASRIMEMPHVEPIGIHVHMGRHSKKPEVWESYVRNCIYFTKQLSDLMEGWRPDEIDFGGGFQSFPDKDIDVVIQGYEAPDMEGLAQVITSTLRSTLEEVGMEANGIMIEIEPGRGLYTDTGVHLTKVLNVKEETENLPRKWIELDTSEVFLGVACPEDPPFDYYIANKANEPKTEVSDIVGMSCNFERLYNQVNNPVVEPGDVVSLLHTGAYTESMAANFNALPRPGTLLVCGDQAEIIKRHETIDEVYSRDEIPERFRT